MRREELVLCEDCPDRVHCSTPESRCDIVRWVADSTAAQGLPLKVTDPMTIRKVATLLRS